MSSLSLEKETLEKKERKKEDEEEEVRAKISVPRKVWFFLRKQHCDPRFGT
jgi:hypothetical protein